MRIKAFSKNDERKHEQILENYMYYSQWQIWWMAIRPKTLWAAVAPVMIGTAIAYRDGLVNWESAGLCLVGALFIQIGTNLANDYFDWKKGTDREDRIGPPRVTQAGLLKPGLVQCGFVVSFLLALCVAYGLIERAGSAIAILAVVSVISGILYTAGPWPLGYLGLGEIFVLIFFGPVAVAGTYYVQSFEINPAVVIAGLGPGFLSAAVLVVNNLRDIQDDQRSGKMTLAARFGRSFAVREYICFLLLGCLTPLAVYLIAQDYVHSLAAIGTIFLAVPVICTVLTRTEGPALNSALAKTARLLLIYSVVYSVGFLWPFLAAYLFAQWRF